MSSENQDNNAQPMQVDDSSSNAKKEESVKLKSMVEIHAPAADKDVISFRRHGKTSEEAFCTWDVAVVAKDFRLINGDSLTSLNATVDELKNKVLSAHSIANANSSSITTVYGNVNTLHTVYEKRFKDIEDKTLDLQTTSLEDLKSSVARNKDDILDVATTVATLEAELETKFVEIEDNNKQNVQTMLKMLNTLVDRVNELENKLEAEKIDKEQMRKCYEEQMKDMEGKIESGTTKINDMEIDMRKMWCRVDGTIDVDMLEDYVLRDDIIRKVKEADVFLTMDDLQEESQRVDDLKDRVNKIESEVDMMNKQVTKDIESVNEKYDAYEMIVKNLEQSIGETKESLWSVTKVVEDNIKNSTEQMVEGVKTEMMSSLNELAGRYVSVIEMVNKVDEKHRENLKTGITIFSEKIENMTNQMVEKFSGITKDVSDNWEAHKRDFIIIGENIDSLGAKIGGFETRMSQIDMQVTKNKSDVLENKVSMSSLKEVMETANMEISDIKTIISDNVIICSD